MQKDLTNLKNDKAFYQSIPIKERSQHRKQMIEIPQKSGQQPIFNVKPFEKTAKFSYNNYQLNYGLIELHPEPEAILFYFHGMYVHANTGGYFCDMAVNSLNKGHKINAYALDFMNAGESQGECPGYYESIDSLVDQANKFIDFIVKEKKVQKAKIFISGLSMGGLVCFKLAVTYPQKFAGIVMFAPALKECYENAPFLKKLGRCMGAMCPTFKIVPQDYVGFTTYENLQFMKNQKGRYRDAHPPGTAYALLRQMDRCHEDYSKLRTPYILIQGGIDKSVDLFAPLDLEKESPSKDKTTIYYRTMWHDVQTEMQGKEAMEVCSAWIADRV